jgi:hypothetical protein
LDTGLMLRARKLVEADREKIAAWMAQDADHKTLDPAAFWEPGTESFALEDEDGTVMYVRCSNVMRIDIQFDTDARDRTRAMLREGFEWLKGEAKRRSYREMIFDSVAKPLIWFCMKTLGFRPVRNEYHVTL